MKFRYLIIIAALGVGSSCNQSAAPKPEANTIGTASTPQSPATPAQPLAQPPETSNTASTPIQPEKSTPLQGNQETKRIDPPRLPPLSTQGKIFLEQARVENGGTSLPKNFPKDIPVYPGATIESNADMAGYLNVTLMTPDDLDQVQAYYEKALKERGWKIQLTSLYGRSLHATQPDRECTVNIDADALGRGTILGLVIPPEKK